MAKKSITTDEKVRRLRSGRRKKSMPAQLLTAESILENLFAGNYGESLVKRRQEAIERDDKARQRTGSIQNLAVAAAERRAGLVRAAKDADPAALPDLAAEYASLEGLLSFYDLVAQDVRMEAIGARRDLDDVIQAQYILNNQDHRRVMADKLRAEISALAPYHDGETGKTTWKIPRQEMNKLHDALDDLLKPPTVETFDPAKGKPVKPTPKEQAEIDNLVVAQKDAAALRKQLDEQGQKVDEIL